MVVDSNILQQTRRSYLFEHCCSSMWIIDEQNRRGNFELFEETVSYNYQWLVERSGGKRPQGIHEIDAFSFVNAKLDTLAMRLDKMNMQSDSSSLAVICEICSDGHEKVKCQVESPFANTEQV